MNGIKPPSSPDSQSALYQKPSDNCPVCLETFAGKKVMVLKQCKHMFHRDCLERWLSKNSTCPSCRTSLVSREVELLRALRPSDQSRAQALAMLSRLSAATRENGNSSTDRQRLDRQAREAIASSYMAMRGETDRQEPTSSDLSNIML
ncbi:RING finger domain-containing protein [Endozoicomonas sp. ALC020]|uniref:RING finger domain-containing protein n=1 Tax=unclassified Endozoicomonas TaxID=2644528 RepID=UPI003BB21884